MKPEQMNTADVVGWLRLQSSRFARMADDIESTLGDSPSRLQIRSDELLTPEAVVTQMNGRKMRMGSLAKELGRSESELEAIMTEENGFTRGERAWYTYTNSQEE